MRHARAGKKLGRDSAHRKALYSNLTGALIEHGRIETTEAKAKELRPYAEKLITLAKKGDLHAKREAAREIHDRDVLVTLFDQIGPKMAERPGGYLRILKTGFRQGDGAETALIELVDR